MASSDYRDVFGRIQDLLNELKEAEETIEKLRAETVDYDNKIGGLEETVEELLGQCSELQKEIDVLTAQRLPG